MRIDDPAPGGIAAPAEFFADDGIVRPVAIETVANRVLDRFVDFGDRRLILFVRTANDPRKWCRVIRSLMSASVSAS